MKKNKLMAVVSLLCVASMALAGCGNSDSSAAVDTTDDGKMMTVDVFDSLANYQGVQKGWFGKIVQDKFKIKLNIIAPNVAGGGNTLYDTRTAAGNLGDLIITSGSNLNKLAKANLITDLTPYLKGMKNLNQYKGAQQAVSNLVTVKKGTWGMPQNVSNQSPLSPSEGIEPAAAPYIRWDYYAKVGYPQIPDMDAFLTVLKQMQDKAREETGKNDIYAISLFKDWDGALMQNAGAIANWFGYYQQNSILYPAGTQKSGYESAVTKDGVYQKVLKWINKAYQMGIVDPDSATQSWDNISTKTTEGKVLLSLWSWLGQPRQNSEANMAKGVGFMLAPLKTMKVYSAGAMPTGNISNVIAVGSKAKNKSRLVKFIDWLYSSEGVYDSASNAGSSAGIKGLAWKLNDEGKPYLTEFGLKAMNDASGLNMPKEYGGGSYNDGISALNFPTISQNAIDPETKQGYNPQLWDTELAKENKLKQDWSDHMGGAKSTIEYLEKNKMLAVAPGASYTAPEMPSKTSTINGQVNTAVVSHSWKAAMAKSDADFDNEIKQMTEKVNGLDFKQVYDFDQKCLTDLKDAQIKIVKQYAK